VNLHKRDSIEAHLTVCPPAWPSAAGSKRRQPGRPGSSSAPPAATGPSRSRPAPTPSPPPNPYPTTSAKPSKPPAEPVGVRTNLSQLGAKAIHFLQTREIGG